MVSLPEDTIVAKTKRFRKKKNAAKASRHQAGNSLAATEFWCFSGLKVSYTHNGSHRSCSALCRHDTEDKLLYRSTSSKAERCGPKGEILVSTGIFSLKLPTAA